MYWSSAPKAKISHKELKGLKTDDRIASLLTFCNKYKHSDEWTEAITYILKHQQDQQFSMLSNIFSVLVDVSKIALGNALDNLGDDLKLCRSMGVFYLIMKYLAGQKYVLKNLSTIKTTYNNLITKYSLYEKDILALEDISPSEYPKGLIEEVSTAIESLPKVFEVFSDKLNLESLDVLLAWVSIYPQQTKEQVQNLSKFCAFLTAQTVQLNKYTFTYQHDSVMKLIMSIIQRCQMGFIRNQNLNVLIQNLPESVINGLDQTSDIINTDVSKIIMALNTLTKSAITPKLLRFVYIISQCFKRDQDFHALHRIYKEFILPQLVRRGKALICQQQLQRAVEFFVYGFMDHAGIAVQDIDNFVSYANLISHKNMVYWIKLALVVSHSNDKLKARLKEITDDLIKAPLEQLLSEGQYLELMSDCWEMEKSDLAHQRKKYALTESKLSGIKNPGSSCYIISAMQALYVTKLLPQFLKNYSKQFSEYDTWSIMSSSKVKLKLLFELHSLMKDLKDSRYTIKIDPVKANGPADFQKNDLQQDCHEYIIQLFDCVQKQLAKITSKNKASAINDFKTLFELGTEWTLECQNCKTKQTQTFSSNMHSIGVHENISFEWTDHVAHTCQKCNTQNPARQQKFKAIRFPQILLIHLKRFEYKHDKSVKTLGVSEIPRKFKNYQLLGFISHIGRNARCGHYVFYCRKEDNPLIWYEYNDEKVYQFKLTADNQLFQRNFKASNTPYILVYKMINKT